MREGDEAAFVRLIELNRAVVHRVLSRLVGDTEAAGDVAHEVFVQLFRRPPAPGEAPLRSVRRRQTREEVVARDPFRPAAAVADLTEAASRAEERNAVRRALVRLADRHLGSLVLRSEGLSYAEVAAALGVAHGSVGTLLARAERGFKDACLAQRGGL